jgi:hypothetical protein
MKKEKEKPDRCFQLTELVHREHQDKCLKRIKRKHLPTAYTTDPDFYVTLCVFMIYFEDRKRNYTMTDKFYRLLEEEKGLDRRRVRIYLNR